MANRFAKVYGVVGVLLGVSVFSAHAASPFKQALPKKVEAYIDEGVVIGGRSGKTFSLLNVRRDLSPKLGMERVILDMGDGSGRPLKGSVNYFHASIEKNPPRVVLDLAQTVRSGVTDVRLREIFKKSPYVKKVDITADPEDSTASLVLVLKEPMDVEVFEMLSDIKASRIVIDLKRKTGAVKAKK